MMRAQAWVRRVQAIGTGQGRSEGGIVGVGRAEVRKIGKDVDGLERVCSIGGVRETRRRQGPQEKSKDALTPRTDGDKR